MKKYTSIIIGLFLVSFLCGCGPTKEEKNEEIRKHSMGTGNLKVDGSSTAHGGL